MPIPFGGLMRLVRLVLVVVGLLAGTLAAQEADTPEDGQDQAQPQGPAGAAGEGSKARYQEVVEVHARPADTPASAALRVGIPIRLLPASVGVVPAAVFESQGSRVLGDALGGAAGLNVATGFGVHDFFVIRGFDSLSSGLVLTDGVPEPSATFYPLYDVERIEVWRGPAAFQNGGGPLAGAVFLVRKRPIARSFMEASFGYGSYGSAQATVDANRATADGGFAVRLNGLYQGSDGYRDGKESRLLAVNPTLLWHPRPSTDLRLDLEYVRSEASPDSGLPLVGPTLPDVPRTRSYQSPFDSSEQDILRLRARLERRFGEGVTVRDTLYYTSLDWRADGTLLTGVFPTATGSLEVQRTMTLLDDDQTLLGNQLELSWPFATGRVGHELLAGVEVKRAGDTYTQDVAWLPGIDLLAPVETATLPHVLLPGLESAADTRSLVLAPYLIDRISPSRRLDAFLGARLDVLDYEDRDNGVAHDDARLSPLLGVRFSPLQQLSLYASASSAFAPPSTTVIEDRAFEKSRQVELGSKLSFLEGRGLLTLAVYHLERENMPIPDDLGVTRRLGTQRSRGFELELLAETASGLSARAAYAYNDARLTRFAETVLVGFDPPTFDVVDRSGNRPRFAPEHLLTLWAEKRLPLGLSLGAGLRYVGRQMIAEDNLAAIEPYWLLSGQAGYQRGRVRASLALANLTGTEYETRGFGSSAVIPGAPFEAHARLQILLGELH
jgi:TonB-dependent siderophore receptor